jgi:hypothetical protein
MNPVQNNVDDPKMKCFDGSIKISAAIILATIFICAAILFHDRYEIIPIKSGHDDIAMRYDKITGDACVLGPPYAVKDLFYQGCPYGTGTMHFYPEPQKKLPQGDPLNEPPFFSEKQK